MRFILIPNRQEVAPDDIFRYALSTAPLTGMLFNGMGNLWCMSANGEEVLRFAEPAQREDVAWVVPDSWRQPANGAHSMLHADDLGQYALANAGGCAWLAISSGRFSTYVSNGPLERLLDGTEADLVAVTVSPRLLAYREHVRLTQRGELVGYRRLFRDSVEPAPVPADWPHHLFIKTACLDRVLGDGLPSEFSSLLEKARACRMSVQAAMIAGNVADMQSADGLLAFCRTILTRLPPPEAFSKTEYGRRVFQQGHTGQVSAQARFIGPVLLGDNVCIEQDAVIIGPSVLCDGSTVQQGAVVNGSIVGAGVTIGRGRILKDTLCRSLPADIQAESPTCVPAGPAARELVCPPWQGPFKTWPRFSYAGCWKRVVDFVGAAIVLALFAVFIPFIALAIKINSPGPLFFKDKRQGLHGKPFYCVKFRTMRVGAAEIQDKLRFVSEVDGPQFKMADDPRISTVGRFLRETYLDEIPQFFNVLMGQMSLVGPRPSPEAENTLCPWWRDARLSVRPGITGLWQLFRTREPYRDFQEWIYYDTWYIQKVSVRMDLWVCWRTFKAMVNNVIRQF